MKWTTLNIKDLGPRLVPMAALVCMVSPVFGQASRATLGFGDRAPALQVKWVKGGPIAKFDGDKIYVVEFWATWCGPCKAAMPHLSELARKLAGKVEIIGVNVLEEGKSAKAYSTLYPRIKSFVDSMDDRMDYNVAMDDDGLFMAKNWMEAARQKGIPATFVIRGGRVIFIGHPSKLDKVLDAVLAGTYDQDAARREYERESLANDTTGDRLASVTKDAEAAMTAKDPARALRIVEEGIANSPENLKPTLEMLKMKVLLRIDLNQGLAYARARKEKDPIAAYTVPAAIESQDGLPAAAYLFAIEGYEEISKGSASISPSTMHSIAACYAKAKNLPSAIAAEEKAIALANEAMAAHKPPHVANPTMIKNFQDALVRYRTASN